MYMYNNVPIQAIKKSHYFSRVHTICITRVFAHLAMSVIKIYSDHKFENQSPNQNCTFFFGFNISIWEKHAKSIIINCS